MLRVEDCVPGALVQCIAPDDDGALYLGEIYTIRKLHEPGYWTRDRRYVHRHSISLEELPDNSNAAGEIDVFRLELFRLVPRDVAETAQKAARPAEVPS
ncbi:hypothetical protein [Labrys wisconsinensis]|uniref:Uncharacterized protein n=1 Tax=Labrys wisconsinensis TaxID=425677 RepID=A0ABU0JER8_9HYPH|nr:hypothetical protein [Labrys wisconsinensis]MDQ0472775.1 hypothetical protein [Labrys wisconsinensis]